jgi:hypothetical protein
MTLPSGESIDRIPVWIQRVTQDLSVSPIYDARFWNPPKEQVHQFKHGHSKQSVEGLKIYEAHGKQNHVLVVLMRCSRNLQPCDANHDLQRV